MDIEIMNNKQSNTAQTKKTIVMAHRGGNFGPENSLKNFTGAINHRVEGIEFDVSMRF